MKEQAVKPGYRTQVEATEGGNDQATWDMLLLISDLTGGNRAIKTPAMEVRPEIAKTGATEIFLACSIGHSYGFYGFQGRSGSFSAKIRSQHAVWMHSAEVDALFRQKSASRRVVCTRQPMLAF
jgi:hypothetical protein